jgi:superfamily II DNA or RNA helicase
MFEQGSLFEPRRSSLSCGDGSTGGGGTAPTIELRPYQRLAVERIIDQHKRVRSTLLVMATGTGKTTVFADVVAKTPGKAIVLAHRGELIDQAAERIRKQTGKRVSIEKAQDYANRGADVVVASVQSLQGERLARWGKDEFSLVVADEAHHYLAPSFRRVLDHFSGAKILGVTATPDRADEAALGDVFDEVAHVYDITDAIADGYLCRIRAFQVQADAIDLAEVKTIAGDLNQGELDAVMSTERALHAIAKPTLDLADGRRTIVFTTSVENAHRLAEVFCRYKPESARAVDGTMGSEIRRRVLGDHRAGRFQVLCNVAVLTEGYDDPAVSCIAMGRPTKSRALYAQMAGRGTRIAPGKEDLLLLDFVGNSGRHALVSAADLLGGKYPEDVCQEARRKIADRPGYDATKALEEAAAELAERERKKAAEALRRAKARARVGHTAQQIDPFKVMGVADPTTEFGSRFGDAPASEAQLRTLDRFGVPLPEGMTKRGASRLIGEAIRRREAGLCTFKQARRLQQFGYPTDRLSFVAASRMMSALAQNGWHRLPAPQVAAAMERQPGEDDV